MNGDEKSYFEALLNEKFLNLHGRIDDLKESVDQFGGLPCRVHEEKIKGLNGKIGWVWCVMLLMVGALAKTAFGW